MKEPAVPIVADDSRAFPALASEESARGRFASALRDLLRQGNYATPFIASRCKSSIAEVARWKTGASMPDESEWAMMRSVSREFHGLTGLLADAWREWKEQAGQSSKDEATPAGDGAAIGLVVESVVEAIRGVVQQEASERETDAAREPTSAPMALLASELASSVVEQAQDLIRHDLSLDQDQLIKIRNAQRTAPTGGIASSGADLELDRQPSPRSAGSGRVLAPTELVVYTCKIGRGRILHISLPLDLTRQDVDRLHAFMLTQVD